MKVLFLFYLLAFGFAFPIFGNNRRKERYIIQLKAPDSIEKLCTQDDNVKTFRHLRQEITKTFAFGKFEGFVGEFSQEVVDRISNSTLIESITKDTTINAFETQESASAHLVRLSQEEPIEVDQEMDFMYSDTYQGEGIRAYVIDTGVYVDHPEFEGRAELGPNFSDDLKNVDFVGHGTHVAGIIGSKTFGVAKKIQIHSIKVLDKDGQGSLSSVIAGLEYAVNHMNEYGGPSVANLSLGSVKSSILDAAVKSAYQAGLLMVAAAGNSNKNACQASPAGSSYVITVGAINDFNDNIAHFSNWGNCVDIFAGGVNVRSLYSYQYPHKAEQVMSGTSMASPIVAGISAILMNKGYQKEEIVTEIKSIAVSGSIPYYSFTLRKGSPNLIANNGYVID